MYASGAAECFYSEYLICGTSLLRRNRREKKKKEGKKLRPCHNSRGQWVKGDSFALLQTGSRTNHASHVIFAYPIGKQLHGPSSRHTFSHHFLRPQHNFSEQTGLSHARFRSRFVVFFLLICSSETQQGEGRVYITRVFHWETKINSKKKM